ncbi:MAG: tRNA uridine-5-carboxymethylaminomethyl(34) synthesis GTPase MnmE [Psittacicella sp.]
MLDETIVAQATASGRGGIGVVRVSGPASSEVAKEILGIDLTPRQAYYLSFKDEDSSSIDMGIALYFKGPNSFTGEDVLELQGHGGPIVLDLLIKRVLSLNSKGLNIRLAQAGEFTQRAFLNGKIDLAQAESIIDLIEANSVQAAKGAIKSLQGEFSKKINDLLESLISLRVYIEAGIDFPDEEIDFLEEGHVKERLITLDKILLDITKEAKQGVLIREGAKVVILGLPNAGKSSILNALSQKDSAIVTDIEGTTRDILTESIYIDGIPINIIDTAGIRDTLDPIEKIGVDRAISEIETADHVLCIIDDSKSQNKDEILNKIKPFLISSKLFELPVTYVHNKIDLLGSIPRVEKISDASEVYLSALSLEGIDLLKAHLKEMLGYNQFTEDTFTARRRHLEHLKDVQEHVSLALSLLDNHDYADIVAEELRLAQNSINEITGKFDSEDLLTNIFSSFCIGK